MILRLITMRFWKLAIIIFGLFLLGGFLFFKPAKVTLSTILFIPQVFPQIPIKPLELISQDITVESIEFLSGQKKVVGKIWRIDDSKPRPAIIIAMGVRTAEHDQPVIANFAQALAKIGFVVVFANLSDLQNTQVRIEEKETFIEAFKYLENLPYVDKYKISFMGISVGSSIALAASTDPQISDKVRAVVFFGGYYNIVDYFASLITRTVSYEGKEIPWQPKEGTVYHLKEIVISLTPDHEQEAVSKVLKEGETIEPEDFSTLSQESQFAIQLFKVKNRQEFDTVWDSGPSGMKQALEEISPNTRIAQVKTRLFILHDTGDDSVPFYESRKLVQALPKDTKHTVLEVSLFDHVKPKEGFSWGMLAELFRVYTFIWKVVYFVS